MGSPQRREDADARCRRAGTIRGIATPAFGAASETSDAAPSLSGEGTALEITNGRAAVVIAPFIAEGDYGIFATDETNTLMIIPPRGFEVADFAWVADQLLGALTR